MKLAFLKFLNIQKATKKQLPKVVKIESTQPQCLFEGIELQLRQDDFSPALRTLTPTVDHCLMVLQGELCTEHKWAILTSSVFWRRISRSPSLRCFIFLLWPTAPLTSHHCFQEVSL